jgi:hypothetical protein
MAGNEGSASLNKFFNSRGTRDRMSFLFSKPEDYDAFSKELDQERRLANVSNTIMGGSPTQRRLAEERERAVDDPEAIMEIARHPAGVQSGLVVQALRMMGRDPEKVNNLTSAEVTKMLLNPRLHENMQLLDQLDRYQRQQRVKKMIGNFAADAATAGGAAGAASFMTQPPPAQAAEDPDLPPPQGYAEGGRVGRNPNRPLLPGESLWPNDDPGFYTVDELKRQIAANRERELLHARAQRARDEIDMRDELESYFEGTRPRHDEALLAHGSPVLSSSDSGAWGPFAQDTYLDPQSGDETRVSPMLFATPFGDKAASAGGAFRDWLSGRGALSEAYGRRLRETHEAMDAYRKQRPWRARAGDAGQLALSAPFGGETILGQALTGAGIGAVDDLLSGSGSDQIALDALMNAGMIGVGGKLLPAASRFARGIPSAIRDAGGATLRTLDDLAPSLAGGY